MKKIYIYFISFSLIACKSNHEIVGIATNAKDGASIRTEDEVYIIEDNYSWNDSLNNKKIKAIVQIKRISTINKNNLYDSINDIHKQGRVETTIFVKLKSIEIIK